VIQSPIRIAQGLAIALGLFVAIRMGMATAGGAGTFVLAAIVLACLYGFIFIRWQRGFYGLLAYLPFAGAVTLALYPWKAPLLFKDLLFVLPLYIGFFARLSSGRESLHGLPRLPTILMIILGIIVVAQMANPGVENYLMGLIGLKVWLFYLPLFFLSFAFVASERDLFLLLRLLVVLSLIPSIIGIAEALLVQVSGYHATMNAIYGGAASIATQRFTAFQIGAGILPRIPSTFTFVAQYMGYTLAMLGPCYALWRADPSPRWRQLGGWVFLIVTLASFLSGARAAFVFVPLLIALIFGVERGFSGMARGGIYVVGIFLGALAILRVGSYALYEQLSRLFVAYTEDIVYSGLVQAIAAAPLGAGTGTNTGPARYAFVEPVSFVAIENYYAKAAYELGILGLLVVMGLFLSLAFLGYHSHQRLQSPLLRVCSAGLLAFLVVMILNSFKGWQIDLDPINVYFWVFAGVLMKLPALDKMVDRARRLARNHGRSLSYARDFPYG
jgi:hypothetical protein